MSVFSTKRIKTASKDRSKINLSSHVITTNDFGFSMPVYAREVVPGDKWSINMRAFARLAPLPVPSLTSVKIVNRAYYVRFCNVWRDWQAFWEQRPSINSDGTTNIVSKVPTFSNADFVRILFNNQNVDDVANITVSTLQSTEFLRVYSKSWNYDDIKEVETPPTSFDGSHTRTKYTTEDYYSEQYKNFDIRIKYVASKPSVAGSPAEQGYYVCVNFTPTGRRVLSVMRALGYNFNFTLADTTKMSLLPLLCYCRTFYDYILPSKYSNDLVFRSLFVKTINDGQASLRTILKYVIRGFFNFYENDYFTASWVNPYTPNGSASTGGAYLSDFNRNVEGQSLDSNTSVFHPDYGSVIYTPDGDGVPTTSLSYISKYALDSMQALYNWGTRRGLAGNKYFEAIFSTFGVKLPNVMTNRCEFLGSSTQIVQISDVMATAQTNNDGGELGITNLGDYAGKGISAPNPQRINFEANDYGYVIITSQIIPETGYTQGRSREVMHIDLLDYFDGAYDCMGMQAIRNDELYCDYNNNTDYVAGDSYGGHPSSIFGFTPRYTEYKCGRDLLNGDFRINHLNTGLESYHTFRLFAPPSQDNPISNSLSFRQINPENNGSDFDRIFYVTDNIADHFIMEFDINAIAMRKMKSVQDSIEIDGGQTINVDPDNNLSN